MATNGDEDMIEQIKDLLKTVEVSNLIGEEHAAIQAQVYISFKYVHNCNSSPIVFPNLDMIF